MSRGFSNVTSQTHGFAVSPETAEVSHVSLYDGTVEGLDLPQLRARSLQFHPEAGPEPTMQIDSTSVRLGIGDLLDPGLEEGPRVVRPRARLGMELER